MFLKYKFYTLIIILTASIDLCAWVSLERPRRLDRPEAALIEHGVVVSKKIGSHQIMIRFPKDPVCRKTEQEIHLFASEKGVFFSLKVQNHKIVQSLEKSLQNYWADPEISFVSVQKNKKNIDIVFQKNRTWGYERLSMVSGYLVRLSAQSFSKIDASHIRFIDSFSL